jgi:hypothetical protein
MIKNIYFYYLKMDYFKLLNFAIMYKKKKKKEIKKEKENKLNNKT